MYQITNATFGGFSLWNETQRVSEAQWLVSGVKANEVVAKTMNYSILTLCLLNCCIKGKTVCTSKAQIEINKNDAWWRPDWLKNATLLYE